MFNPFRKIKYLAFILCLSLCFVVPSFGAVSLTNNQANILLQSDLFPQSSDSDTKYGAILASLLRSAGVNFQSSEALWAASADMYVLANSSQRQQLESIRTSAISAFVSGNSYEFQPSSDLIDLVSNFVKTSGYRYGVNRLAISSFLNPSNFASIDNPIADVSFSYSDISTDSIYIPIDATDYIQVRFLSASGQNYQISIRYYLLGYANGLSWNTFTTSYVNSGDYRLRVWLSDVFGNPGSSGDPMVTVHFQLDGPDGYVYTSQSDQSVQGLYHYGSNYVSPYAPFWNYFTDKSYYQTTSLILDALPLSVNSVAYSPLSSSTSVTIPAPESTAVSSYMSQLWGSDIDVFRSDVELPPPPPPDFFDEMIEIIPYLGSGLSDILLERPFVYLVATFLALYVVNVFGRLKR